MPQTVADLALEPWSLQEMIETIGTVPRVLRTQEGIEQIQTEL